MGCSKIGSRGESMFTFKKKKQQERPEINNLILQKLE